MVTSSPAYALDDRGMSAFDRVRESVGETDLSVTHRLFGEASECLDRHRPLYSSTLDRIAVLVEQETP